MGESVKITQNPFATENKVEEIPPNSESVGNQTDNQAESEKQATEQRKVNRLRWAQVYELMQWVEKIPEHAWSTWDQAASEATVALGYSVSVSSVRQALVEVGRDAATMLKPKELTEHANALALIARLTQRIDELEKRLFAVEGIGNEPSF